MLTRPERWFPNRLIVSALVSRYLSLRKPNLSRFGNLRSDRQSVRALKYPGRASQPWTINACDAGGFRNGSIHVVPAGGLSNGRACCPQRAVGGRPIPHFSNTLQRSRRAGDSAPYHRSVWPTRADAAPLLTKPAEGVTFERMAALRVEAGVT